MSVTTFDLHHMGFLVEDILKSADDFIARFGYVLESDVIEDPIQTACVQFLRQPGAPYWLELISPNGSNSKLSKALQQGGGLHHFCYEVENLAAASDSLRSQGMLPLGAAQSAIAFSGRRIAWFMDRKNMLVELLEKGPCRLTLANIR